MGFEKTVTRWRIAGSAILVCLLITGGSFQLTDSAWADESDREQKAAELLELMQVQSQVERMMGEVQAVYQNQIKQMALDDRYKPIIEQYQSDVFSLLSSSLSWTSQKAIYIDAYASAFSEKELADIIQFLKSDSGKRFVSSQLEIQEVTKAHGGELVRTMQPQLQALSQNLGEQMKAAAGNQQAVDTQ